MSTERCGVYCGGERCRFCGSLKLAGLTPSSTRRAVAYDAAHQVVARFDVTAAEAYNGMGGYWSLIRLADACRTRYLPGAVSVTWDDARRPDQRGRLLEQHGSRGGQDTPTPHTFNGAHA